MFAAPRRDLREYLAQVPDPRGRQGKRHDFTATLTAVICAILQNCRGYEAIAQWLAEQPLDFLWSLGFTRRPPTETGVRRLLSRTSFGTVNQSGRRRKLPSALQFHIPLAEQPRQWSAKPRMRVRLSHRIPVFRA